GAVGTEKRDDRSVWNVDGHVSEHGGPAIPGSDTDEGEHRSAALDEGGVLGFYALEPLCRAEVRGSHSRAGLDLVRRALENQNPEVEHEDPRAHRHHQA